MGKHDCEALLTCALKPLETVEKDGKVTKAFVIGKTRSYFRMGALEYLEAHRTKALGDQALEIQRYLRGWLIRKETMQAEVKRRKNAIKIQRCIKMRKISLIT